MRTKKVFSSELAYVVGILAMTLGTACMEKADFGMSMVVAPAYVIHLKLSQSFPSYSFGVSEYLFQACLLVVLSLVLRKCKVSYLFSFVTALIYGTVLDLVIKLVGLGNYEGMAWHIALFVMGMMFCALGVSFFFHTYMIPEAYELFVRELSASFHLSLSKVKTVYDCSSCLLGVILSFAFFGFGKFEGVNWGTVVCSLVNGWLIGRMGKALEAVFDFRDTFHWRAFFDR